MVNEAKPCNITAIARPSQECGGSQIVLPDTEDCAPFNFGRAAKDVFHRNRLAEIVFMGSSVSRPLQLLLWERQRALHALFKVLCRLRPLPHILQHRCHPPDSLMFRVNTARRQIFGCRSLASRQDVYIPIAFSAINIVVEGFPVYQ
jgi:hypothetical protein